MNNTQRGLVFVSTYIVLIIFSFNQVYAITEIPNYADIYLNYSGNMFGFKFLWSENYSGYYDEFGGIVIDNGIGYTVQKNGQDPDEYIPNFIQNPYKISGSGFSGVNYFEYSLYSFKDGRWSFGSSYYSFYQNNASSIFNVNMSWDNTSADYYGIWKYDINTDITTYYITPNLTAIDDGTWEEDLVGYPQPYGRGVIGNITAFNSLNGSLVWRTNIGKSDGTPLIDNNNNYIYINIYEDGDNNGIYKLNKNTGEILYSNKNCSSGISQSLTQNKNLIFGGCRNGTIFSYNKNDLTINWSYSQLGITSIDITPLYIDGTITFGGTAINNSINNTVSLNATNGQFIWSSNLLSNKFWDTQPSSDGEVIYIGDWDSKLFALNKSNGIPIWNLTIIGGMYGQTSIYKNKIIIADIAGNIRIINKSSGVEICSNKVINGELSKTIFQGLSITNDIGFFGSSLDNAFFGINTTNCNIIFKNYVNSYIWDPATISNGRLFIKDDYGKLYSFDLGKNGLDWSYLGYDNTGKSSCDSCAINIKYIESNCSGNSENYNCTIINNYNEEIYTNLINSSGYNYTILMQPNQINYLIYNSSGFSTYIIPPMPEPPNTKCSPIQFIIFNFVALLFPLGLIFYVFQTREKYSRVATVIITLIILTIIVNGIVATIC